MIRSGATRILTSGGASGAPEGAAALAGLVQLARGRITILQGGGISASNIADLAGRTHGREFHSGLSSALPYSSSDFRTFEAEVRKLARAIHSGEW